MCFWGDDNNMVDDRVYDSESIVKALEESQSCIR